MYLGLRSHGQRADRYEDAVRIFQRYSRTETGRARKEKLYGFPMHGKTNVRWVRCDIDGSIVFRLYNTDVLTYYPDGLVEIEAYPSKTTSDFLYPLLPLGIGTTHLGVIEARDPQGEYRVYRSSDALKFRQSGEGWEVEGDLGHFYQVRSLKSKDQRRVEADYHLVEFRQWAEPAVHHLNVRISDGRLGRAGELLEALKERRFRDALEVVPAKSDKALYAYGRDPRGEFDRIDFSAILRWAAEDAGALTTVTERGHTAARHRTLIKMGKQWQDWFSAEDGWKPEYLVHR